MTGPRDLRRIPADMRPDLAALGTMVRAQRTKLGLSQRALARQLGLSSSTIPRVEDGKTPDVAGFLALADWLETPPRWFVGKFGGQVQAAYRRGWDDCAAAIRNAIGEPTP